MPTEATPLRYHNLRERRRRATFAALIYDHRGGGQQENADTFSKISSKNDLASPAGASRKISGTGPAAWLREKFRGWTQSKPLGVTDLAPLGGRRRASTASDEGSRLRRWTLLGLDNNRQL
jgi:hypothetical protein